MANPLRQIFREFLYRRSIRRWSRQAREALTVDLLTLRAQRARAKRLRTHLDELIHVSENRLTLPLIGSNAFQRPVGTDWAWRPKAWRGPLPIKGIASVQNKQKIGEEVTVFHDCDISELTIRQVRNQREEDLAPFGMRMDVFKFDGTFLSLVIDLPPEATEDLKKRHLVRFDTIIEMEKPIEVFARLNIKHGPNTEQIVRELPLHQEDVMIEFDLAYTKLNEKRVERIWVDLIFEGPENNQVTMRDVTFSRRPRADL